MVTTLPTYSQQKVVWGFPIWNILVALAVFIGFSLFTFGTASAADLSDIGGHWAAAEIERAVSTGYVQGYPDGTFRPDAEVTRAEFLAMVDRAFQVPAVNYGNTLEDVSTQDWFAQDVASALAAGFVNGYPDGTFRPQEGVSREEAACILAKLLKMDDATTLSFSDADQIDSWAQTSVSGLVSAGIMTGYPDGTFRPQLVINRAEAVVMINKALAFQSLTPVTGQLQVTGDAVNVRSGPSTSAPIIGQANSGDILQAKAKNDDDWYQIDYQEGSGWVAGQYVQDYQPAPASSSTQATSSMPANSQASNSPTNSQVSNTTSSNSTEPDSTPGSIPAEPSRGDPAPLSVLQIGRNDGSAVDIQGAQAGTETALDNTPAESGEDSLASLQTGQNDAGNAVEVQGISATLTPVTDQLQVTGDAVNIRSCPDTGAQIIGQVNSGDVLQAKAENSDDWYEIDYQGSPGWVAGQYVQVCQPASVSGSAQAASSPSATSSVQATVSPTPARQGSSTSSNGASFYGMDLAAYPGDDVMQAWWDNSPFCYTGFYLGPAPYHPDTSFMDQRQVLVDQGWGLLPIYVGRQADSWNLDQGIEDGDDAVNLATSAGFPSHTVIFLDIETSSPLSGSFLSYVTDWVSEVESKGYIAGIYCFVDNAIQIGNALPENVQFWVSYYTGNGLPSSIPSPADSGVSFASAWQFVGDTYLTYGGDSLDIDINTSTFTDPATESVNVKK